MKILHLIFGRFQSYRKLVGGVWTQIAPWPALPEVSPMWVPGEVRTGERCFDREYWTK